MVVNNSLISDIRDHYPLLFTKVGLLDEFYRLCEFSITERFEENLQAVAARAFLLPPFKGEPEELKKLRNDVKGAVTDDERSSMYFQIIFQLICGQ